jgi:phosphatidylglycerol---prolipoprotein diacylglyceryl transferase
MIPVLFSVGPVPVSSFGLFLVLGFLAALFIIWRMAKAYDLDEGKIFDFAIITFVGGLICARALFVILNWQAFINISHIFLINLYPGFTFWGGLLGGVVILKFLTIRAKLNFWQIADIASVGLIIGLVFTSFGCFLSGCSYGIISNSPLAVSVVGLTGKRFPITIFESLIFLFFFFWLWKSAIKFHFQGKIFSLTLILFGLERFFTEGFKGDSQPISNFSYFFRGQVVSLLAIITGIVIYYIRSKRSFIQDLLFIPELFYVPKKRILLLQSLSKSWYNTRIGLRIKVGKTNTHLGSLPRKLKKKLNVKSTPRNY